MNEQPVGHVQHQYRESKLETDEDSFICSKCCWIIAAIVGLLLLLFALLWGLGVFGGEGTASGVSLATPSAAVSAPVLQTPELAVNTPAVTTPTVTTPTVTTPVASVKPTATTSQPAATAQPAAVEPQAVQPQVT